MVTVTSQNNSSTETNPSKTAKDELFIDDEADIGGTGTDELDHDDMMLGIEGSGMDPPSKGTGAEDMESSGSGYGPDDEDAQVGHKNKGKPDLDSEEDEDDIDDDEEDDEESDFNKEKPQNVIPPAISSPATTTSTTTTTTENYEDKSKIFEQVCLFNICVMHVYQYNKIMKFLCLQVHTFIPYI